MTKYHVYDQSGNCLGATINLTELSQFLSSHTGCRVETTQDGKTGESTLPRIQEDAVKPAGEFLRQ